MRRIALPGLRRQAYEHPLDREALAILDRTPGIHMLVRKLNEWGFERLMRVHLTGSYLRVTPDMFPDIYASLRSVCEVLDVREIPDLYIYPHDQINAFTIGVERPIIGLSRRAVDYLTKEELRFVLGLEVGHIKSEHVLYYQIADFMPFIVEIIGATTLGLGELLGMGLRGAIRYWRRMSDFTADRAGLLACQDANPAIGVMMKMAGLPRTYYDSLNTEDFIAQARAFEELDVNKLDLVAKWIMLSESVHPWTVIRAKQFLEWIDCGEYERVVTSPRSVPMMLPEGVMGFCQECGRQLRGVEVFCPGCGESLG